MTDAKYFTTTKKGDGYHSIYNTIKRVLVCISNIALDDESDFILRYLVLGEINELKAELNNEKKEKKKEAVKKVIASMTVGKDVR